jgi:uncharacterized protein
VRRGYRNAAIAAVGLALLILAIHPLILERIENAILSTGPNGPETPAAVGVAFDRLKIPSGSRFLDAYLVAAPASCRSSAALLIFHGVGETISQWVGAQRLLNDHSISSIVFDYSGDGNSSPPATIRNLHQDAVAAYSMFHARFAPVRRLCIIGFSMGNAVMLDAFPKFRPAPACVVVGSAFSSGRQSAVYGWGIPSWVARLTLPDEWDNVEAISYVRSPLLVVHSDADRVNPLWMGERIYQAAPGPKQLVILHGIPHNAAYRGAVQEWWAPVIEFVSR